MQSNFNKNFKNILTNITYKKLFSFFIFLFFWHNKIIILIRRLLHWGVANDDEGPSKMVVDDGW